jgi:RIO kinase 1
VTADIHPAADNSLPPDPADSAPSGAEQATPRAETSERKRNEKASFERNAEVQRWLKEQASEETGVKPPFDPTFLAHQRDRPWVLSSLTQFYDDDLITDVLHMVKSGKEATVYCCAAHPRTGLEYVAAKVYRPRMFRSLKNDAVYRQSRVIHDDEGHQAFGRRARLHAERKTEKGRLVQVAHWIGYEYETQHLLYDAGADVPRPLAQEGNAVLMEYIGVPGEAAPLLREVELEREEARPLFERILRNVELWLAYDRIHGDLSAYNMLYWQGDVTIIDFAQAVEPRYNYAVYSLLARDVERVCQHFARYGVETDPTALAADLWERYLRGTL